MTQTELQSAIVAVIEAGDDYVFLATILRPVRKMRIAARANILRDDGYRKADAEWTARDTFQPPEWEREFLGALAAVLCERAAALIPLLDTINQRGLLGLYRNAARDHDITEAARLWSAVRADLLQLAKTLKPQPSPIAPAPVDCHIADMSRDVLRRLP